MKRIGYSLLAAALALGFNACEGHSPENLSEHYQHKAHANSGHHDDHHGDKHDAGAKHEAGADHGKKDEAHPKPAEPAHK